MMHYLPDGPAAGTVLRIQLLVCQSGNRVPQLARERFNIVYPAIYSMLGIGHRRLEFADRVFEFFVGHGSFDWCKRKIKKNPVFAKPAVANIKIVPYGDYFFHRGTD